MEPEKYKIEVLHFINPYLIWVEVPDLLSEENSNFSLEQIGIYGVLPMDLKLDASEGTLVTKRSKEWIPATRILMQNAFSEAVEISFVPLRIDSRSTIFDDNIHKYGEIVIKKRNGKYRILSKLLIKSGFGIQDEEAFESELSNGNIKTKLSHTDAKDVIKNIEKKCKSKLAKQTKVFQTAQNIESALTVQNLEAHNRKTKKTIDIEELLQKKLYDLQMCKEAETQSVGRATKKVRKSDSECSSVVQKAQPPNGMSKLLEKRLKLLQASRDRANKAVNSHTKDEIGTDNSPTKGLINTDHDFDDLNNLKSFAKTQSTPKAKETTAEQFSQEQHNDRSRLSEFKVIKPGTSVESEHYDEVPKMKRPTSSPKKMPTINIHKEILVAYGPPDTNFCELPVKIVPKASFVENYHIPEEKTILPAKEEKEDLFAEEDCLADSKKCVSVNIFKVDTIDSLVCKDKDTTDHQSAPEKIGNVHNIPQEYSLVSKDMKNIGGQNVSGTPRNVFSNPVVKPKVDTDFKDKVDSSKSVKVEEIVKSDKNFEKNSDKSGNDSSESVLQRKMRILKQRSTYGSNSDTSTKDSSTSVDDTKKSYDKDFTVSSDLDSDDSASEIIRKVKEQYPPLVLPKKDEVKNRDDENFAYERQSKNHVNPFKNVDPVFVEKLVTPVLVVHSKMNKQFQPVFGLRDVPFGTDILIVLKKLRVERPMMIQTISWLAILRGYSTIIVSPKGSGKTMGYLPAVCRLVSDNSFQIDCNGPSCIIVCATSELVSIVEELANMFCGRKHKVLALYSGMDDQNVVTSLLNGCDLLVTTPPVLVKTLQDEHGVDLRRLTSLVLDDCERVSEVYMTEIKFIKFKIKEMLKKRINQEVKVQYVLASRVWCDFMEPLAKKAPNTVVCIGAFQECVLYSKTHTIASFVTKENKTNAVLDFINEIDISKRTVIVCTADEEVTELEKVLKAAKYAVLACNSEMTVQDLYNLSAAWIDYQEPVLGPILVCCDGNLAHLNVTDAHYLVHYSLPNLYSTFCKRFAVLTENYASIFKEKNENVKIKILLEDSNVEHLPKILNFIKRCTSDVPEVLDEACERILKEKDLAKAKILVPICNCLLAIGECPDFWNCRERHAIFKDYDNPDWVPQDGFITFKLLHFYTAIFYSARLLTHITNGETIKYPNTYSVLAMKIAMHFSVESNRKLHGTPKVGDICAVAIRQNFLLRCQVVKILSYYQNGTPNEILVNLIDEERLEKTKDVYLYHLPEALKATKTHAVHIRLANIKPRDKDVTFSELAKRELEQKVPDTNEKDVFMRGKVVLTVGNCILVDNVEVCRQLSISDPVVVDDFKKDLLEKHAMPNPGHVDKLKELCVREQIIPNEPEVMVPVVHKEAKLPPPQWAHLEKEDFSEVYFLYAVDPDTFFVCLAKFASCCTALLKDIQKHVNENPAIVRKVKIGDLVLAKIQNEDDMYERAKVVEIVDDFRVNCFFVDQGYWCDVPKDNLQPITEKFITQLPFQAIECRLLAVEPVSDEWSEWVTNCLTNFCLADNPADKEDKIFKPLFAKYFVKEEADHTNGSKYAVVLMDTTTEQDIVINEMIVANNLAKTKESEAHFLEQLDYKTKAVEPVEEETKSEDGRDISEKSDEDWEKVSKKSVDSEEIVHINIPESKPAGRFIRSVPLVGENEFETSQDKWDIQVGDEFKGMFKWFVNSSAQGSDPYKFNAKTENLNPKTSGNVRDERMAVAILKSLPENHKRSDSDSTSSSIQKEPLSNDSGVISSLKLVELDSDDLTSPISSQVSSGTDQNLSKIDLIRNISERTTTITERVNHTVEEIEFKKPKLLWHQKQNTVSIKIELVGVEKYDLKIESRRLKFYGEANETHYAFEFELYGVVDPKKSRHSNKGQYILVTLTKMLKKRNWLSLIKDEGRKKWIVYDVDALDYSSSEDEVKDDSKDILKNLCKDHFRNSDTEDEDFVDDADFSYSR